MVFQVINENELLPYFVSNIPSGPYLVFAPHPDDETLGMGGTIALASKQGIDVYVVFITDGGKGGDPEIRKKEAESASEILGIKSIFYLNLPDREVAITPFPEQKVDEILKQVQPQTVFLPSFQEIHPDHRAVTNRVLSLLKTLNGLSYDLWFYEINRQGEINRLVDISSVLDIKESAIECYSSQLEKIDYKIHTLCLNFMRSITIAGTTNTMECTTNEQSEKINYAEGFWHHDRGEFMSPEEYYFSQIYKYRISPPIQQNKSKYNKEEQNRKAEQNRGLDNYIRHLRDKVKNQAATLLNYFNLSNDLACYINDKISEIKRLKQENDKNIYIIKMLEKKILDIDLSRSHRLASAYIKSATYLRLFFQNFKKKNVCCCISKSASCSEVSSSAASTSISSVINGEPVIRLYSEDEIESTLREHDVYLESSTYGNKHLIPLFNNQPIAFSIECSKKNLARIALFMGTYKRINPGVLVLSIYENNQTYGEIKNQEPISTSQEPISTSQEPIRTCQVMTPIIIDDRFLSFDFEPITDSDKKIFYIKLSLMGGFDDKFPGLWTYLNPKMNDFEKYQQWIQKHEYNTKYSLEYNQHPLEHNQHPSDCNQHPSDYNAPNIAVIIHLLNSNFLSQSHHLTMLSETLESVQNQSFKNWQMIIIHNELKDYLYNDLKNFLAQYINDSRITIHNTNINCSHNTNINGDHNTNINVNISNDLNKIIDITECEYFLVLQPYDTLAPNALQECVNVINQSPDIDCIYSDEDKISKEGLRFKPFFKPDWSPDLLLSCMYIGNFILYKKSIFIKSEGYISEFKNYREYDAILKFTELTINIHHIPKILYHQRESETPALQTPALQTPALQTPALQTPVLQTPTSQTPALLNSDFLIKAVENAVKRRGIDAKVYYGLTDYSFRVARAFDSNTLVSIIIPFRDNHDVLQTCIQSIVEKSQYKNYEIICVNNQSKNRDAFLRTSIYTNSSNLTEQIYKGVSLQSNPNLNLTLLDYDKPFNYSAINNYAVKHAKGEVILFLNSDTEVISGQWLNAMLEHVCRAEIGAVGAKLYYINDTIQHAGVVVGIAGLAGHAFKHVNRYEPDFYYGFPSIVRNVSAVTGACMMVRKSVFEEVGGFDEEHFQITYNDLDLCMKIRKKGYGVIYTPFAELYHYESYSRGYCFDLIATDKIKAKWGVSLEVDPFYNPNLTTFKEDWGILVSV